jgi:formamidopyrimidine-DNA glycosylase
MPELAEVEYFRKQWDPGLRQTVRRIAWHPSARIFRGIDPDAWENALTGARLLSSAAHGKQMLFRFNRACLGLHLGMTGKLHAAPPDFEPGKHDHLVLFQKSQALVFSDFRLFGRVLFQEGPGEPVWWTARPPDLLSAAFTKAALADFLARRKSAPLKAVLLMQERFPGIGNWMADEILWRARLLPSRRSGTLSEQDVNILWKNIRAVCREALRIVGKDFSDPPDSWLFPHRWTKGGACPRCGLDLRRAEVGGRTTCWCSHCQVG